MLTRSLPVGPSSLIMSIKCLKNVLCENIEKSTILAGKNKTWEEAWKLKIAHQICLFYLTLKVKFKMIDSIQDFKGHEISCDLMVHAAVLKLTKIAGYRT